MDELLKVLSKRPLVFDGAMGTMIEANGVSRLCNEELCLSRPSLITDIHRRYIEAGSDVITTNTFGANAVSLRDFGLSDSVEKINFEAARIARTAAEGCSEKHFVAGSVGPTSKLPSFSHISFDELFDAYSVQVRALADGGVDIILIETCQDLLQAKAALAAAAACAELPTIVSVTLERLGTMLLGTELAAALVSIAPYHPFAFGMNCATGPADMEEHLSCLDRESPFPVICQPNAGLPEIEGGRAIYRMRPDEFGGILSDFAKRYHIAFVGGCCGTTPDHIASLSKNLKGARPRLFDGSRGNAHGASSIIGAHSFVQQPRPFIIAEQTNVNGSKRFRNLHESGNIDGMVEMAKEAAKMSHALDVCLATPGGDESHDFVEFIRSAVLRVDGPVMLDSTDEVAIEAALKLLPGRSMINSINLEDGGERAGRVLRLAKKYGAAVVGLVIGEDGMAREASGKLAIAERIIALAKASGLDEKDLFIDMLTFTLASGDPQLKGAALETLSAIRGLKKRHPNVNTILGVSNVSYGLPTDARKVLNSVFLHEAVDAGLDAAIINPSKILPENKISKEMYELCKRVIKNDHTDGNPLSRLISLKEDQRAARSADMKDKRMASPREVLRLSVMDGNKSNLKSVIEDVLRDLGPREVIGDILLPAMGEVGRQFGEGRLALPFVLESAEAMRAACDVLALHMKGERTNERGTIILATVKGDVHDIGKNLVDIILTSNGFNVVNLGIRQPASRIIEAAKAYGAHAIGLSGLIVSSAEAMREGLVTFAHSGLNIPVLCGGAALSEKFVRSVLKPAYGSDVHYCKDAFEGFVVMDSICKKKGEAAADVRRT